MQSTDTLAMLISAITSFVTGAISWVTSFVTLIVGQPVLLLGVITSFVGLGIGLIKRLMRI